MQQPLVNIGISAAREAGRIITGHLYKLDTLAVSEKASNDFVSEVDLKAEQAIINVILDAYPDHSILAEENGEIQGKNTDIQWIIDPLDGTRNYLHGFPHFAISIAVKEKGRVQHAIIHDPIRQEFFTASRGRGAYLDQKRIRVSKKSHLDTALLATGFPFKNKSFIKSYLKTFEALFEKSAGIRRAGSAALDLAYVAAGRLDGFWEFGLQPWDFAAGSLLIQEAGGMLSDFQGSENYWQNGDIVAGNPKIFKAILQTLHPILQGQTPL